MLTALFVLAGVYVAGWGYHTGLYLYLGAPLGVAVEAGAYWVCDRMDAIP